MAKNNRGRKKNHNKAKKRKFKVKSAPDVCSEDGSSSTQSDDLEQPREDETVKDVAEAAQEITEETIEDGQEFVPGRPIYFSDLPERFNVGNIPLYSRDFLPFVQCDVCSCYSVKALVAECTHKFCKNCCRLSKAGRGVFCLFCRKQMPFSLLEISESLLAYLTMQCRCGYEGSLEEIRRHSHSQEGICLDSTYDVKHLVTNLKNVGKAQMWIERSQYLLPKGGFTLKEVRPPRTFDIFLETVPRNPKLPHVFFDFEADGLFLGRLHLELRQDIVPKTVAKFLSIINDSKGFTGAEVDFILPNGFFQVRNSSTLGSAEVFPDENYDLRHDQAGTVSMTNFGEDTNQSGFYIAAKPLPWRDGFNVVFGCVISGNQVINRICELGCEDGSSLRRIRIMDCGLIIEWTLPSISSGEDPFE